MAVTIGTDAYVSEAEVTAYLAARGSDTAWVAAGTTKQSAAIIEATSYLDANFRWTGTLADTEQPLGWPRVDAYDREGRLLPDIPAALKNACSELANLALGGRLMPMNLASSNSSAVKRRKIGDVEVEYANGSSDASYDYVSMLLAGIGAQRSATNGSVKLVRA